MSDKRIMQKLAALRQMALHLGLIEPCTAAPVSEASLDERWGKYGAEFVIAIVAAMLDERSGPAARAAAGVLLEMFIPHWREVAPAEWVGAVTIGRDDPAVREWREAVIKRDEYRCQSCGAEQDLHAHHIVRWVDAPQLRVVVDNGTTLCRDCHVAHHAKAA